MKELPPYATILGKGGTFNVPLGGFTGWMRYEDDNWVQDHCSGKTVCMEYAAHCMSEVVAMNKVEETVITESEMEELPIEEEKPKRDMIPLIQAVRELWTCDMPVPVIPVGGMGYTVYPETKSTNVLIGDKVMGTVCIPEQWVKIDPSSPDYDEDAAKQIASTKPDVQDVLKQYEQELTEGCRRALEVTRADNTSDPHGIPQHTPGAKNDKGKMEASLLLSFPRALWAVGEVATYGAQKYSREGWQHVPDGIRRYKDAEIRHILKGQMEKCDHESGLPHEYHRAWNVLASLELTLRAQELEHTTTETGQEATEGH